MTESAYPQGDVTFGMLDVQGSTALLARVGPDVCASVFGDLHRLAREVVEPHGGTVFKTEGDGAWLSFGRPEGALRACTELVEAIAAHPWPIEPRPSVRVALHRGEAVVRDGEYVSMGIHQLARVGHGGHGDQVICTEHVLEGTTSTPALRLLGAFWVRDFDDAVRIHQVGPGDFPALALPRADLTNLTRTNATLVGRAGLLADVEEALRGARLVTLLGPGGAGKTSAAVAVALRAVEQGNAFWLVNLAPVEPGSDVDRGLVRTLAGALGLATDALDHVLARLGSRQVTLLVDNCEHVRESAADLIGRVLAACPTVRVLATSREALRLRDEVVVEVDGLALPEPGEPSTDVLPAAVELFETHARRTAPSFRVDARNWPAVVELCRALDGLPLALEIAASSMRHRSPQQVLDQLQRSGTLPAREADRAGRHGSLLALVDWSLAGCTPEELTVFRRLAAFAGYASAEAIEAVVDGGEVEAALGRLVDKSLVRTRTDESGSVRFGLLATMRMAAARRLAEAGEESLVLVRHARWVAGSPDATGTDDAQEAWRAEFLRAVERSADLPTEALVELVHPPRTLLGPRSPALAAAVVDELLSRPDLDPRSRTVALLLASATPSEDMTGEADSDRLADLVESGRRSGSALLEVMALCRVMDRMRAYTDVAEPLSVEDWAQLHRAAELYAGLEGPLVPYVGFDLHNTTGVAHWHDGDLAAARLSYLRAIACARKAHSRVNLGVGCFNVAELDEREGKAEEAAAGYAEAARVFADLDSLRHAALAAGACAQAHATRGDEAAAADWTAEAVLLARRSGSSPMLASALAKAAVLARQQGQPLLARTYAGEALELDPDGAHGLAALEVLAG